MLNIRACEIEYNDYREVCPECYGACQACQDGYSLYESCPECYGPCQACQNEYRNEFASEEERCELCPECKKCNECRKQLNHKVANCPPCIACSECKEENKKILRHTRSMPSDSSVRRMYKEKWTLS